MKLYVLLIVVMAAATIIENIKGTPFVQQSIYGSWWFSLLWALLVALAIAYLLKRHVRRWNILLLHAAMVVMLLGALLTHLMAYQGVVHLRGDQPSNEVEEMTSMTETTHRTLPFYIRLDKFEKLNHAGTDAAADYVTRFVIMDGPRSVHAQVSMNKIYHYRGIRFYQASYDTDNQGSYLNVNSDPWGIPVTYAGYALFFLALRWIITGNIPMGNGYETMLSVAWMTQLATLIYIMCTRKGSGLMTAFAFLLSGFFLLVSHLSMMDPAMGPLVPVLNSPLLSIHVSFMMMSYALLALTFLCGIMGLVSKRRAEPLQLLSRIFLYPAIVTLGIGIFLGAVWANVSWGNYWSWDPKETWALITFMIYAVALHTQSLPALKRPRNYHLLMTLAFLSIVMTYFGVNYFLSGMHSYA